MRKIFGLLMVLLLIGFLAGVAMASRPMGAAPVDGVGVMLLSDDPIGVGISSTQKTPGIMPEWPDKDFVGLSFEEKDTGLFALLDEKGAGYSFTDTRDYLPDIINKDNTMSVTRDPTDV